MESGDSSGVSNDPAAARHPDSPAPEPPPVVTVTDFETVDIEAPIRELGVADPHAMFAAYNQAVVAANEAENARSQRVYVLLRDLCGMFLQASNRAAPWVPMMTLDNSRTAIAEDFRGPQTDALSAVVGQIANPGLRARIADVAWSNNRRDGHSAVAAIDAYCDCVTGLLDGTLKTSHGRAGPHEAYDFMHRAMLMAKDSTSRKKRPPRVAETFEALYAAARQQNDIWTFVSLTDLALDYLLRQPDVAAADLESFASSIPVDTYPMAVKRAWDLAAQLYHNIGNKEARQRCLKGGVEQLLAMREQVRGSAAAEAGWVQQALMALRHVEGMEEREYALELELRRLQKASLKQMRSIEINLELEDVPEHIAEQFGAFSLSESLKRFALMTKSRDPDELRAAALQMRDQAPLMSMLSVDHIDDEGRTGSKSSGAPTHGEPDEAWYFRMIDQSERLRRARVVRGFLNPARTVIQARFGISERHFNAIAGLSAFIPESQKPIMALGFTRLFQGDFMSATYLLIPQLEPCLRHLLKINGIDPSKRRDDGTEEDLSLGVLLSRFQAQLEKIIPAAVVFEINILFNAKPGPELRHEVAHGQIGAGACFSDVLLYANWFLFHLSCLFVLPAWEELVTPQLAEDE